MGWVRRSLWIMASHKKLTLLSVFGIPDFIVGSSTASCYSGDYRHLAFVDSLGSNLLVRR